MNHIFKKVWPELEGISDDDQDDFSQDRSSLMDIEDPALRNSLEIMQRCFVSPGHRATLTMFLTELLELEELNEIIRKLHVFDEKYREKYIEKFQAYFVFYTQDHENDRVRESARKYFMPERVRKDSSTFKAVQMETAQAANAVVEKAIDPRSTDTFWPVPSQMRPPAQRSKSNSSIPAARQTHQGVNSERNPFRAANVDAIFAEGRQAAGLDEENKK
jgi:hypothetical protein